MPGSEFTLPLAPLRGRCEAFRSETRQEFRLFPVSAESLDDFRYTKAYLSAQDSPQRCLKGARGAGLLRRSLRLLFPNRFQRSIVSQNKKHDNT